MPHLHLGKGHSVHHSATGIQCIRSGRRCVQSYSRAHQTDSWCADLQECCNPLPSQQVSQLLAAPKFQEHSGEVLESLSIEEDANQCFEFAAPPEAYPVSCLH